MGKIASFKFTDPKEAISKFYSEISKVIYAQIEDKDLALELLGEKVLATNRQAIPMIASLDTKQWLRDFDYAYDLLKYVPSMNIQTANLPPQEELNYGTSEHGVKPRKLDLNESDYNEKEKNKLEQEAIKGEAPVEISPAVIAKSGFPPASPEESLQEKLIPVEKPVKSNKIEHPEQNTIEQKAKVYFQPDRGEQAPQGVQAQEGPRGGSFYETKAGLNPNVSLEVSVLNFTEREKGEILDLFDTVPMSFLQGQKFKMEVKNKKQMRRVYSKEGYSNFFPLAYYDPVKKEIVFYDKLMVNTPEIVDFLGKVYPSISKEKRRNVYILHEFAHLYYDLTIVGTKRIERMPNFKHLPKSEMPVSDYAAAREREYFAESYTYYVNAPKVLKEMNPSIYNFLREEVFDGKEY